METNCYIAESMCAVAESKHFFIYPELFVHCAESVAIECQL